VTRALWAEALKLHRTWILPLVFLGPFGVVSLNVVRWALHGQTVPWSQLVLGVNSLLVPALILGIAILASLLAGVELPGRMWKQLGALPLRPGTLYVAKFLLLALLLAASGVLCVLGMLAAGWIFAPGQPVPWPALLQEGFGPYLGAYLLMGIQLALSVLLPTQAWAIAAGIVGVIMGLGSGLLPHWLPWSFPELASPGAGQQPQFFILCGVGLGLLLALGGALWFTHQERP